ncbi:MAG: hypothetical protein RMZ69_06355 [Nostoc sp. ChiQUE01a]|nr:hypothetical protein [Nostoc sp. ChiQUE01a]
MNQPPSTENELPSLNQALIKAQQKAKWLIRIAGTGLALSVVGAIVVGVFANNIIQQAQEAQNDTKLDQQGFVALNQFENQQIKALLTAMEAGNRLKKLIKDGQPLDKYPATIPILALQTILDNIHERNQIQKYRDEVYDISFSSDGQRFVTVSKEGSAEVRDLSGKVIAELKGHSDVRGSSFSPDGRRILTWSYNNVRIWDLSGKLLSELKNNNLWFSTAIFSQDGQRILTSSYNSIQIWDLLGNLTTQFEHKDWLDNAIFSPDGKFIAITTQKEVFIRDLSGKLLAKIENPENKVSSLPIASFSPDGRSIITTHEIGKSVYIWDLSGKLLKEFKFENGYCAISPGGQHFVCLSFEGDNAIGQIWDSTGNLIKKFDLYRIGNVKFSSDGKHIVISSSEYTFKPSSQKIIQVLDLSGKQSLPSMKVDLPNLLDSVIVKPDKQLLITVSNESDSFVGGRWKNVQVWDLSDKQLAKIEHEQSSNASFSPDGKHIVTYGYSINAPFLWDSSGNYLAKLEGIKANTRSANFSPDGKLIVTTSEDKIARVWDLSGKLLTKLEGDQDSVSNASFSPDGQRIITTSSYVANIWDLSGRLLTTLEENASKASIYEPKTVLENASFSPDGKHILAVPAKYIGGQDKKIFIWDLSGKQLAKLTGTSASFSPNGQQIVVTNGSIASVHDLSGKLLAKLEGHQAVVNSANFSPNGQYTVTASSDQTARVWDLSGKLLVELKGHNGEVVENASFSPDGERIMTTSNNTRIFNKNTFIWDLSGRQLAKFENSGSASFSPDGKQIFIVSSGVKVWRVGGLDELLARGCDWLKDYTTSHPEAREKLKECQQR